MMMAAAVERFIVDPVYYLLQYEIPVWRTVLYYCTVAADLHYEVDL